MFGVKHGKNKVDTLSCTNIKKSALKSNISKFETKTKLRVIGLSACGPLVNKYGSLHFF